MSMADNIYQNLAEKKNYQIWKTTRHTSESFQNLSGYEQLKYLCILGHLATNTHNTQPWRFYIDTAQKKIDIYLDRSLVLPASDKVGRQSIISLGCSAENITVAAKYLGLKPKVELELNCKKEKVEPAVPSEPILTRVASVYFESGKQSDNNETLFDAIFERKTIRAEYDPKIKIDENIIEQLKSLLDKRLKLHAVTDSIRRQSVAEFQAQADGFVINSKEFSRELGDWLLPNDTKSCVGMPGIGFGLQDGQAQRLHLGLLGKQPLEPEDGLRFSLAGKAGIEKSPLVCFITSQSDEIADWFVAGRNFEKIFLYFTSLNFNIAIHAGIVEVRLINKMFASTLGTMRKILILFRAGKVLKKEDANRPHSPRLPIENVLLKNQP